MAVTGSGRRGPCHGSQFNASTGAVEVGPAATGLDPASLGEHRRDGREGPVEQHHPGHRTAGLAARAHRDAQVGLLEGLHVVDTVAAAGATSPGRRAPAMTDGAPSSQVP